MKLRMLVALAIVSIFTAQCLAHAQDAGPSVVAAARRGERTCRRDAQSLNYAS